MALEIKQELIDDLVRRAEAQAQQNPAPEKKEEGVGLLAKILFASGLGADAATTIYGQATGKTREVNPVLKPLGKAASPVGAAAEIGGMMLLNKLIGKKHPKIMKGALMGLGAMHGGAAIHNLNELGKSHAASQPAASASPTMPSNLVQLPDGSWADPAFFPNLPR